MELKESLQKKVEEFKKNYPVDERVKSRITTAFHGFLWNGDLKPGGDGPAGGRKPSSLRR